MRIIWDEVEKQSIALQAVRIEQNGKVSFMELIRRSQEILAPDRRRKIVAIESVPWLRDKMYWAKRELAKPVEPPPEVKPEPEVSEESGVFVKALANELMKCLPDILMEKLVDRLSEELTQRITTEMGERLLRRSVEVTAEPVKVDPFKETVASVGTVVTRAPVAMSHVAKPQVSPAKLLKKALIIGANPIQEDEVRRKFRDQLDMTFWKEEGLHSLKSLIKHHKFIVVLSDKCGRQARDLVTSFKSKESVVKWAHGGSTSLKASLEEVLAVEV